MHVALGPNYCSQPTGSPDKYLASTHVVVILQQLHLGYFPQAHLHSKQLRCKLQYTHAHTPFRASGLCGVQIQRAIVNSVRRPGSTLSVGIFRMLFSDKIGTDGVTMAQKRQKMITIMGCVWSLLVASDEMWSVSGFDRMLREGRRLRTAGVVCVVVAAMLAML